MGRPGTHPLRGLGARCAALAAAAVLLAFAGTARAGEVVVIGHPDLPVDTMSVSELKHIYVGEQGFLGDVKIEALDYLHPDPCADTFLEAVVGMNQSRFHAWWVKEVFHGGGIPPRRVDGTDLILELVASQPGTIGYVPAERLKGVTSVKRLYTVSMP